MKKIIKNYVVWIVFVICAIIFEYMLMNNVISLSVLIPCGSIISLLTMICGLVYIKEELRYGQLSNILVSSEFLEIAHFMNVLQKYDIDMYNKLVDNFKQYILDKTKAYDNIIENKRIKASINFEYLNNPSFDIRTEYKNRKNLESLTNVVNDILSNKLTWDDAISRSTEIINQVEIIRYNVQKQDFSQDYIDFVDNNIEKLNEMKKYGLNVCINTQ